MSGLLNEAKYKKDLTKNIIIIFIGKHLIGYEAPDDGDHNEIIKKKTEQQ